MTTRKNIILIAIKTRYGKHLANIKYGKIEKSTLAHLNLNCRHYVDRKLLDAIENSEIIKGDNVFNNYTGQISFSCLYSKLTLQITILCESSFPTRMGVV